MRVCLVDSAHASYRFFIFTASYLCSLYSLPCPSVITVHVSIWQSGLELYLIRTLSALLHCATSLPPGFTGAHTVDTRHWESKPQPNKPCRWCFSSLCDISLSLWLPADKRNPVDSKLLLAAFVGQLFHSKQRSWSSFSVQVVSQLVTGLSHNEEVIIDSCMWICESSSRSSSSS